MRGPDGKLRLNGAVASGSGGKTLVQAKKYFPGCSRAHSCFSGLASLEGNFYRQRGIFTAAVRRSRVPGCDRVSFDSFECRAAGSPSGDLCTPSYSGLRFVTRDPSPRPPSISHHRASRPICSVEPRAHLSGRYFASSECRLNNGAIIAVANLNLIDRTAYRV